MVSIVPGTFTGREQCRRQLSDGRLACTDFAEQEGPSAVAGSLAAAPPHGSSSHASSASSRRNISARSSIPHALTDLRNALVEGSSSLEPPIDQLELSATASHPPLAVSS